MASASGYVQPDGERRSYLLVDGAQLVPSTPVDVQALDVDYLSFSFHKILAPFGVGVLYGREHLLESSRPFLYGGDMIAQGQVFPDRVAYNALPWKFGAGTPNILGTVISAQALRLVVDLARSPRASTYFGSDRALAHDEVTDAMTAVMLWTRRLVAHAMARLAEIPGLTMYGPREAAHRTSLVSFNVAGWDPMALAARLNDAGVESRAGCHCATLAHHQLALDPPASCRLSFYLYNTLDEVDRAADALTEIVSLRTESRAAR
jgi:cysteine desulfurase/selenocysteine lyase